MWRWASRWASWRRVSLLCLEKIGLLQPYVAPASLAEMAPRLESLTSTRLRELVMPPDFMAAYLEKTNKTSRKLLASWCITIGLINIPGGILDMFEAAAYWRLITLEYRIIITCGFVLAAQLYQRYPLRRAEHIPIIVLANATILISAISTPQSDLFEFHQIHIIMAVVLACSGLIYLPLDGAAAAWLAGSSIVSMTLAISVSQLATVDKASLILFFTCVLTALVQARRTQNVYQHQLFLLRARDELRTEEANRRNEQLSSIAYVDRLTDVPNRRYFEEIADAIDAAPARGKDFGLRARLRRERFVSRDCRHAGDRRSAFARAAQARVAACMGARSLFSSCPTPAGSRRWKSPSASARRCCTSTTPTPAPAAGM